MKKSIKSLLTLILFTIFGLFVTNSFSAQISNCSNCGSVSQTMKKFEDFDKDLYINIEPKDLFFSKFSLWIDCPRSGNSYKNASRNYSRWLSGYFNSKYFWAFDQTHIDIDLILGFKDRNKDFRVVGLSKSFKNNREFKYYGFDNSKLNLTNILDKNIEVDKVGKNSKLCRIRSVAESDYEILKTKKEKINKAIKNLKLFEQDQFNIINIFSKNGFEMEFRFSLTNAISNLSIELAKLDNTPKIIVQEDVESKKLAEQRALELKEERSRLKAMEVERKRLEEKTKQLAEQNRLAELNAKKRSEEIAKEVAAQEREKLEEERALRRAEEKARKIAQEKARQLAAERQKAEKVAKQLELERVIAEKKNKERLKILDEERKKSEKIAKQLRQERIIAEQKNKERLKKLDEERKKSEKIARQLRQERIIAEEKNKERLKRLDEERKKSDKIAAQLRKERKIAEQKARELEKSQQTQLASIQREKEKREELIQEEKKKRVELEKKLAELREQNKNQQSKTGKIKTIKLPPEWMPFQNKMSLQQEQFCQLTNRFFKDIKKATSSGNEIKVNIVHKERQENMDGLLPGGKVNNWIFKVVKIDQVEDGSAAVVLKLQCKSFVGSGQIHTKSTWRKKSNKEWRATIPYEDRRFRELAKLDRGQFILGSGTMLEINAFKPGQKETFYASQQIGEHPLTKGLNLEGELFIADLSYIAALN